MVQLQFPLSHSRAGQEVVAHMIIRISLQVRQLHLLLVRYLNCQHGIYFHIQREFVFQSRLGEQNNHFLILQRKVTSKSR